MQTFSLSKFLVHFRFALLLFLLPLTAHASDPVAKVNVVLTTPGHRPLNATTDSMGLYKFDHLAPAKYTVQIELPKPKGKKAKQWKNARPEMSRIKTPYGVEEVTLNFGLSYSAAPDMLTSQDIEITANQGEIFGQVLNVTENVKPKGE